MLKTMMLAAGLALALTACSKAERQDTANDVQAAADRVSEEAKQAASSPEVKKVGSEIKEAAGDAGTVVKETAQGAAQGAKEGAAAIRGKDASETAPDATKDEGKK